MLSTVFEMYRELLQALVGFSPITIVAVVVFALALLGYFCTRWTECLVIFLGAFAYAALPFLPC